MNLFLIKIKLTINKITILMVLEEARA